MSAMAKATSRPRKTLDDFMALGDEARAELIAGEIYMTPSPTPWHQTVSFNLGLILGPHVREHGLGRVWSAPLDVHFPSGDVVEPDLIYVCSVKASIVQDWIRGVPDLLVEIASPSNAERDRIVKRDLYARNGVPEYWIVDPDVRTIELLRLQDRCYAPAGYFGLGTVLRTETMPLLRLVVDEVFP